MAEFMAEFESNRKRERERVDSLQVSIPALLESASRSLAVLQQHGRKGERFHGHALDVEGCRDVTIYK